jgi:hypothetical protein
MSDQLREQITGLFRDGSLYRESPKAIADKVLAVVDADVDKLLDEIARLRREVEFEANGADTFSGADAQCNVDTQGGADRG